MESNTLKNRALKRTVIMEVSLIPGYIDSATTPLKELIAEYEKDYNVKIIPVDSSKKNSSTPIVMPL